MMTYTILQRIYALADSLPYPEHYAAASILRAMCSDKDPATKAHAITGTLRKVSEHRHAAIVGAIESLLIAPGGDASGASAQPGE